MNQIPIPILLAVTMTAYLGSTILRTLFSRRREARRFDLHLFNALPSIVCAIMILVFFRKNMTFSTFTVALGLIFGAVNAIQQIAFSAALSIGTLSYTCMIASMSTVLSALSGAIFWHEPLDVFAILGLALMVVCLILSVKKEEGERKKASVRWLLLSLITCLMTAVIGILQKTHQESPMKHELYSFLLIAFLFSFCTSVPFLIVELRREKQAHPTESFVKNVSPYLWLLLVSGVCIVANHVLNLYLSGAMPSAVMFPIVNGGGLMLSTLASLLFFKERLSGRQWIGIAFGVAAVAMLCI